MRRGSTCIDRVATTDRARRRSERDELVDDATAARDYPRRTDDGTCDERVLLHSPAAKDDRVVKPRVRIDFRSFLHDVEGRAPVLGEGIERLRRLVERAVVAPESVDVVAKGPHGESGRDVAKYDAREMLLRDPGK